MLVPVEPLDHVTVPPVQPEAFKVAFVPAQILILLAVIVGALGGVFIVI